MTASSLTQLLDRHVRAGRLPGAVAAVASGPDLEVAVVGARDVDGPPMTRDTIFRESPAPPVVMRDFWAHSAHVGS